MNDNLKIRKTAVKNLIKIEQKKIESYHKILMINELDYKENKTFINTYSKKDKRFDLMQKQNEENHNIIINEFMKKIERANETIRLYNRLLTGNKI